MLLPITTINLSACLAEKGKKVLVVDLDPQGNTTSGLGIDKNNLENTIYELLRDECTIEECMIVDQYENLSLLPANRNLAGAELELITQDKMQFIVKEKLAPIKEKYDKVADKQDVISKNKTERLIGTFMTLEEKFGGINILSEPFIQDENLIVKVLNSSPKKSLKRTKNI